MDNKLKGEKGFGIVTRYLSKHENDKEDYTMKKTKKNKRNTTCDLDIDFCMEQDLSQKQKLTNTTEVPKNKLQHTKFECLLYGI